MYCVLCCAVLCCAVLCCAVLCCTVSCIITLRCACGECCLCWMVWGCVCCLSVCCLGLHLHLHLLCPACASCVLLCAVLPLATQRLFGVYHRNRRFLRSCFQAWLLVIRSTQRACATLLSRRRYRTLDTCFQTWRRFAVTCARDRRTELMAIRLKHERQQWRRAQHFHTRRVHSRFFCAWVAWARIARDEVRPKRFLCVGGWVGFLCMRLCLCLCAGSA